MPNYINGEMVFSASTRQHRHAFGDTVAFEACVATSLDVQSALETCSVVQDQLDIIPTDTILRVLSRSMDFYFADRKNYEILVHLSGSPLSFVAGGIEFVKDWVRNLAPYVAVSLNEQTAAYRNTAPVVAILPSNSEQESLYVLAQTLLSKNAAILRPSSKGGGALTALEFITALNKSIDSFQDGSLEPLRSAICIVNTDARDYLEPLCVDGWNYLFFGDESTIGKIGAEIRRHAAPRKIIGYGTGLSMSVILDDADLTSHVPAIMDSVSINRGNECDSTDIVYVHESLYAACLDALTKEARRHNSGNPFEDGTIGWVQEENIDYIFGEAMKRGKADFLRLDMSGPQPLLHTSVIPLNEFESALEYPGPIVSVRPFGDLADLAKLVAKDLRDNAMTRNLVTAIYTREEARLPGVVSLLHTYKVNWNKPTHEFNLMLPHQGVFILRELMDPVYLDRQSSQ